MAKYHMNKAEREITDPALLTQILKKGKYATIGMCRGSEPYVVTLSYGYDPERNCLYFHTAPKGLKIEFIRANPNVCATVIEDCGYVSNECSHRYRSVVLTGKMCPVPDEEEKRHGMEVLGRQLEDDLSARLAKLRNLRSADWDRLAVLRLDLTDMTGKAGQ